VREIEDWAGGLCAELEGFDALCFATHLTFGVGCLFIFDFFCSLDVHEVNH